MVGQFILAALALVMVAGCHGSRELQHVGCAGAAVIITVTPSRTGDGGSDGASDGGAAGAKPSCTGKCDEYLEALRVALEGATPAACVRRPASTVLICAPRPASPEGCPSDTVDAATSLETQVGEYLAVSWPEIDPDAVLLDTCVCHID